MIMNLSQNSIFLENILLSKTRLDRIKISTYLLCKYDDRYWVDIVSDIDEAAGDVKLKFMHPQYPRVSFGHLEMFVPHTHIITVIQTPLLSSASAP